MSIPARGNEELTPPSSLRNSPPTPPPTNEKVQTTTSILRQIATLKADNAEITIHYVDAKAWAAVGPYLLRKDKLRCAITAPQQAADPAVLTRKHRIDYLPSVERIVFRMPTKVHEQFSRSLSGRIVEQLRQISQGSGSAADFAKDVRDVGSATIRPRDPEYGTHDPDCSFQHLKSPLPTVIIEVAHSQSGRRLRTLAEDYLLGSDLAIRVVIGVDIEYNKSKRAAFSVWRAELQGSEYDKAWAVEATGGEQVFRNDDGEPDGDQITGLRLSLEDFADEQTCQKFKDIDKEIFVSSEELFRYLEEAEAIVEMAESAQKNRNPLLKKRRRTQTPEEQLEKRDEDAYAEDEEHASKRQILDDASFQRSSSGYT